MNEVFYWDYGFYQILFFQFFFFSFSISANKLVVGFAYKFQFVISKLNYIHGRTTRFGHTTPMLLSISSSPNVIIYRRNEMDFNWRNVESVPVECGLLGQRILTKKKTNKNTKLSRVLFTYIYSTSLYDKSTKWITKRIGMHFLQRNRECCCSFRFRWNLIHRQSAKSVLWRKKIKCERFT